MPIRRESAVTRDRLRQEPGTLFVFPDTITRRGLTRHSREFRGEPNAVGLPVKRLPATVRAAFFDDSDESLAAFLEAAAPDFARLEAHLRRGGTVVLPAEGFQSGQLTTRAPRIWSELQRRLEEFETIEAE
jgi:hypothetical protein